jgi:multicomponent Na+:H+ antiporter subunit D
MIAEHLPVLPVLVFFFAALLMPLVRPDGSGRRGRGSWPWARRWPRRAGLHRAAHGADRRRRVRYAVGGWAMPIGIELVLDPLSAFVTTVLGLVAALVLAHSRTPVARDLPGRA